MFSCTWIFPFSLYAVLSAFNCSGYLFFLCFIYVICVKTALQCINARVKIRYKFRLILTLDGLQISSWCEYCFNVFLFKFFRSLGPRIGTHGKFMMFLMYLVLFSSLLFGLLMFRKYSVAMLVSVFLLCPFSVKMSIKTSISHCRYFSVHILYARERKPLNTPITLCGAMFKFDFICTFVIDVFERFWNHKSYYYCLW